MIERKQAIAERFDVLAEREDNWDEYGSKKPTKQALAYAQSVINEFVDAITDNDYVLLTPFISTDEDGDITVEWYHDSKEIHLLITEHETRYLKVWGPNINTEMEEGVLVSDNYLTVWEWLTL